MWFRLICYSILFTAIATFSPLLKFSIINLVTMKIALSDADFYTLLAIPLVTELFIQTPPGKFIISWFYKIIGIGKLAILAAVIAGAAWARGVGVDEASNELAQLCYQYDTIGICEHGKNFISTVSNMLLMLPSV